MVLKDEPEKNPLACSTPSKLQSEKPVDAEKSNILKENVFSPISKKREKRAKKRRINEINAEKAVSYIDEMFAFYENQPHESLAKRRKSSNNSNLKSPPLQDSFNQIDPVTKRRRTSKVPTAADVP